MKTTIILLALTLSGCTTGLRKDVRQDMSSISHKTTVTGVPPVVSSEWTFTLRPVAPALPLTLPASSK